MSEQFEPRIVAFFCNWCTYTAADLAGVSRMKYAANLRTIRLMCSGRVDPQFILEAFARGADGVLIGGCHPGDCHYINGNHKCLRRFKLLRRMVRDHETRGASVERTLSMWDSVRAGEEKWIFPFQEDADAIFNTTLIYEPAVLKKHIFPLLEAVPPESIYYDEARSIVKFLNYFVEADVEDEIPPTSILREFIGGNTFYR